MFLFFNECSEEMYQKLSQKIIGDMGFKFGKIKGHVLFQKEIIKTFWKFVDVIWFFFKSSEKLVGQNSFKFLWTQVK